MTGRQIPWAHSTPLLDERMLIEQSVECLFGQQFGESLWLVRMDRRRVGLTFARVTAAEKIWMSGCENIFLILGRA